jgi:hypothetical protein
MRPLSTVFDAARPIASERAAVDVRSQPLARSHFASWILRGAAALVFAGHGALAISVNVAWLPFFAVVGISAETGRALMPLIGLLDVALAVLVMVRPVPIAVLWMSIWAFWTALLRPLSGQSLLEFIERGGNWGAPLALLLLLGTPKRWSDWFRPYR